SFIIGMTNATLDIDIESQEILQLHMSILLSLVTFGAFFVCQRRLVLEWFDHHKTITKYNVEDMKLFFVHWLQILLVIMTVSVLEHMCAGLFAIYVTKGAALERTILLCEASLAFCFVLIMYFCKSYEDLSKMV